MLVPTEVSTNDSVYEIHKTRPNQAKMWSYQSMAHGADSLMYFRYRGATKGAEQFCYGVIDADNVNGESFTKYRVSSVI